MERLPWSDPRGVDRVQEISTFEIIRFNDSWNVAEGQQPVQINRTGRNADGQLYSFVRYTLTQGMGLDFDLYSAPSPVSSPYQTLLEMELSILYKDDYFVDPALHWDSNPSTIHSMVSFNSLTLDAVASWRRSSVVEEVRLGPNDYEFTRGYVETWADYQGRTARVVYPDGSVRQRNIRSAGGDRNSYDNESLFFLLRALRSTTAPEAASLQPQAQTLDFFLPFDCLNSGRNGNRPGPRSVQQSTVPVRVSPQPAGFCNLFIEQHFNIPSDITQSDDPDFDFWASPRIAHRTNLRLNQQQSGPDIVLYYSAFPVRTHPYIPTLPAFELSKVLLQFRTYTFGVRNGSFDTVNPIYTQVFRLVEYWNGSASN